MIRPAGHAIPGVEVDDVNDQSRKSPNLRGREPQSPTRQALGRRGEDLAAEVLGEDGFLIVERNWRCAVGEIDIIARDTHAGALVFCEVKCRSGRGYGAPLEAITYAKLTRLRQLVGEWLAAHPGRHEKVRLDAIGILWPPGGPPEVTHVRGVGL